MYVICAPSASEAGYPQYLTGDLICRSSIAENKVVYSTYPLTPRTLTVSSSIDSNLVILRVSYPLDTCKPSLFCAGLTESLQIFDILHQGASNEGFGL